MDIIDVKFDGNKMFYSTKSKISNDFHFTVTKGKDADSQLKSDRLEDTNDAPPTISILGLEYLFDKDGKTDVAKMEDFAEALNDEASDWVISYRNSYNYGKCLVVKAKKTKIKSFTFSVRTYEFDALSRSKFIDDPKTIGLTVYFDNFDNFYSNVANHIKKVDSIKIFEIPYINKFEVLSNDSNKKITAAFRGSKVKFKWEVGPAEETVEVSLTDEQGTVIGNVSDCTATINEDKKFTLIVKKDGYEVSETIDIKAVYIDELALHDFKDLPAMAIHKGDKARIIWSVKNAASASVHLRDELGTEITESPYIVKIDHDKTFTLEIELNEEVESRKLDVHKTLWQKISDNINCPFKPDGIGEHKIFRYPDGYYIYVHPKAYQSTNLKDWKEIAAFNDIPDNFKYYSYFLYWTQESYGMSSFYTYENEFVNKSILFIPKSQSRVTYGKHEFEETEDWLFGLYGFDMDWTEYFALIICEHSIQLYHRWGMPPSFPFHKNMEITVPENAKIISAGKSGGRVSYIETEPFLAVLCDNKHVYLYQNDKCIKSFEFDRNDQKRVSLVKADSTYVVLDNYVFELNGNNDLSETRFSPIDTIAKKDEAFMFVGEYDNSHFAAIVGDGDKSSLWIYGP